MMCHYTEPRSSFGSPRLCLTRRTSCRRGNMKSVRIPTVYIVTDGFRGPFIVVCTQPPSSLPNGRCSFRGRSTDNWERLVSHLVTDPPPHHNRLLSLPSSPFSLSPLSPFFPSSLLLLRPSRVYICIYHSRSLLSVVQRLCFPNTGRGSGPSATSDDSRWQSWWSESESHIASLLQYTPSVVLSDVPTSTVSHPLGSSLVSWIATSQDAQRTPP